MENNRERGLKAQLSEIRKTVLLPLGEGGAVAPDEGNPPHDSSFLQIVERATLTRRCAPPSPRGRGNPSK